MKWRRFIRILHRDIGYVVAALTIIYSVSGIAVNHINDWNPNYIVEHDSSKIIPLNDILSHIQAAVFDFVPGKPFSTDNYLSAKTDSTCECNDLAHYNIQPTAIESVVPQYLNNISYRSAYMQFRRKSRR